MRILQSPVLLFLSILLGGVTGYFLGPKAVFLKPAGDLFLNFLFCIVIPLVFFSVSSAIAQMKQLNHFGKVMVSTFGTFLFMGITGGLFMILVVKIFPPGQHHAISHLLTEQTVTSENTLSLSSIFTVSDFPLLFSRNSMVALIIFSIFVGVATLASEEKGKPVAILLQSATEVFLKMISFAMYYAPIGFFAYFAVLIGQIGPSLMGEYVRAGTTYYLSAIVYFIVVYSGFAYLAGNMNAVKSWWKNILPTAMTSLATCSSAASIPVNLDGAKKMGVPSEVYNLFIPIGTILHKQGSILGAILKISFLFTLFHMDFSGVSIFSHAIVVALLVGTVMGAIPSGGMIGEMLIVSAYGFPPQALMVIAVISILIDPPATVLNVTGNNVGCLLASRFIKNSEVEDEGLIEISEKQGSLL